MSDHYIDAEHDLRIADAAAAGDQAVAYAAAQARATLAVADMLARIATDTEQHHRGMAAHAVRTERILDRIAGTEPDARAVAARLREVADRWERSAAIAANAGDSCAEDRSFILRHCVAEIRDITDRVEPGDEPGDEPDDMSLRAVVHRAVVHAVYVCRADRDVDLAVRRDLHDLAWHVAGALHDAGHDYPDRRAIVDRLTAELDDTVSWPMDDPEAIDAAVAAICGDPDPIEDEPDAYRDDDARLDQAERDEIDQAHVDHERGLTRHAPVVQPAEPDDLVARRRAHVRAAIDRAVAEYAARGHVLDVCNGNDRRHIAARVSVAISDAGLGQPDRHHLDAYLAQHLQATQTVGWPMDSAEARADLARVLCDVPPEPVEHPVTRRDAELEPEPPAGVPAPRPAVDDTDQ